MKKGLKTYHAIVVYTSDVPGPIGSIDSTEFGYVVTAGTPTARRLLFGYARARAKAFPHGHRKVKSFALVEAQDQTDTKNPVPHVFCLH